MLYMRARGKFQRLFEYDMSLGLALFIHWQNEESLSLDGEIVVPMRTSSFEAAY